MDERSVRERRLFTGVMVLGVLALVFGFVQILNQIRGPFRSPLAQNQVALGPTGERIAELSQKDTDDDGLSDFDELYTYETSPYLADSDSDGALDQEEISGGTDPNCPVGATCSPLVAVNTQSTNSAANSSLLINTNLSGDTELTVEQLRIALLNAGAPESTLQGLDDATLLQLYQEVTGETVTVTNTNGTNQPAGNTNTTLPTTITRETLESLTPDQIREFLIQGGADPETLRELDDATLRAIFEEALQDLDTQP